MKMMFTSVCQLAWPQTCLVLLLILYNLTISASKSSVSYSKHCDSVVPEATSTGYANFAFPYLETVRSSFTGGERILGNSGYSYPSSFDFHTSKNVYATETQGVYKIEAEMSFRVYNDVYYPQSNVTAGIPPRRRRRSGRLKFLLHGFWSEASGRGCFVGSASWHSSQVKQYEYKLISEEIARGFDVDVKKGEVLDSHPGYICSLFSMEYVPFDLEYASNCSSSIKNCSPVDRALGYMPTHIALYSIQCPEYGNKMRFLVQFTNSAYMGRYAMFNPNSTLVGEGLWDEKTNSLVIVGCRISSTSLGDVRVGDCSYRLSLWFPSVWSIKNRDKAVGQIWTNKTSEDLGYFGRTKLRSTSTYGYLNVPGLKYEYTGIERMSKLCPKKAAGRGKRYPRGQSYDMRFDMSVKEFAWGDAEPLFVGNKSYAHSPVYISNSRWGGYREIVESEAEVEDADNVPVNVSYKLRFYSMGDDKLGAGRSSLNASFDSNGQLVISAEGVYDAGTGSLCMVGCRNMGFNHSADCDIVLNFQFPESEGSNGGYIKGSMKSTRKQSDPLFFEKLSITATSFSSSQAQRSIWRIDLEITMVLISNTLACLSICYQIYYARKYPKTLSYISLVMLVILTLGHMIPLVLNFEALFMPKQDTRYMLLNSAGWLEVNEVIVRVVTMAAFLLQSRLLQLAWTAERSLWRIDLEITMVLISNTLACIFVSFQLYHVKRYPNSVPYTSLLMLVILTLGHMVPLVLNFEALFKPKQNTQNTMLSSSGWLEVNEVIVRVATMVAFLLQFRLLQLAWTARHTGENEPSISVAEKKSIFVSLPIYIFGGLVAFLVNWKKNYYASAPRAFHYSQAQGQQHTLWGDLRSYAGLILDGFLFPQVLLNIFHMSRESALSMPFYVGTTVVHSVPHAYDIYRAHNYVPAHVNGTYLYANPSADFYSAAWDIIIPMGGLLLAGIIFLQQKYGGRFINFREVELYAKVPVADT
uniref:RING-type E3 ubiquitin transferase n=1 Tax=Daucus carota subsp. sativus TaxID=79200 RepID=A0A165Z2H3_DAUCS